MSSIIVIRHGNTFEAGEPVRRIGARCDPSLTPEGKRQADRLGAWLDASYGPVDSVLCGPLRRTRQTASTILRHLDPTATCRVASWLEEIDHGPDEGALEDDVVARVGTIALDAWNTAAIVPPGWLADRSALIGGWTDFLRHANDGTSVLVTSNGVARFALLAAGVADARGSLTLRTGAYGCLEKTPGGGLKLVEWDVRP